jgi:hypothetical protein
VQLVDQVEVQDTAEVEAQLNNQEAQVVVLEMLELVLLIALDVVLVAAPEAQL